MNKNKEHELSGLYRLLIDLKEEYQVSDDILKKQKTLGSIRDVIEEIKGWENMINYQTALNYQKTCWNMKLNSQPQFRPTQLERSFSVLQEALNELEELKRVPTAKEVCEAIQEHLTLKKIVYNEKNNSFGWEYGDPLIYLPLVEYKEGLVTHYLPFTTPKILILIGKFYEGQVKEK